MSKNIIQKIKLDYDNIKVPVELGNIIKVSIEKGRKKMKSYRQKSNVFMKVCASLLIILGIFTTMVNISPSFASTLRDVPVIGELVKILHFVDNAAEGGKVTDGLDLNEVEIIRKDNYEKYIFKVNNNGVEPENIGAFKIKYSDTPYLLSFEMYGARYISFDKQFDEIKKSKYIKDIYKLVTLDDSLIRYNIELKKPVKFEFKEMKNPGSIILKLEDSDIKEEKEKYSLRTLSYDYGEEVARIEEQYFKLSTLRVLRDDNKKYFVEFGIYDKEEDAIKMKEELQKDLDIEIYIEKRKGLNMLNDKK